MYRSNLGQIEKLVNSLLLMALGKANFQRAEEYLTENATEDNSRDMSAAIFPYAKWITIVFTIGRLILILISVKHLRICKIYFYYEQILFLCSIAMPLGMTADMQNDMSLVENQKNFSYFYYDLWPSLICTLIC